MGFQFLFPCFSPTHLSLGLVICLCLDTALHLLWDGSLTAPPSLNTPSPSAFPGPVASLLPDPWGWQVASLSAQGLREHRGRCQRPGRQGTGSVTYSESGRVRSFSGRQGAKGEKAGYSPQRRPPGTGQLTESFRFSSSVAVLAALALS